MAKYFYVFNHQNKAAALVKALEDRGWGKVDSRRNACFALTHLDHPPMHNKLHEFSNTGRKIFLYQHGARPNLFNDFMGYEQFENVTTSFVAAPGHAEIMKIIGVEYPIEVIGWNLSPLQKFTPRWQVKEILFAPIHPNPDGLSNVDRVINSNTFNALLLYKETHDVNITIRYIRSLEINGLWFENNITYIQGKLEHNEDAYKNYDLVVAHQTFAYKSIAYGIPTIMMGENIPPRIGSQKRGSFQFAKSFEQYKHLLIYPLDILASIDLDDLFNRTIQNDLLIRDWKQRMIGEVFNPDYFVDKLESYL